MAGELTSFDVGVRLSVDEVTEAYKNAIVQLHERLTEKIKHAEDQKKYIEVKNLRTQRKIVYDTARMLDFHLADTIAKKIINDPAYGTDQTRRNVH